MNRDTICVQGGYTPGKAGPGPHYQSTTFKYATSEDMGSCLTWEADSCFSHAEPHLRYRRQEDLRAGGRHCRHADVQRSGGQLLRPVQHLRGRRPYRGVQHDLRRYVQPHLGHHGQDGHYRYLCGSALHRGGAGRCVRPTPKLCSARPLQTRP